jgi:mycothiol system anti-sigma-R factor
MECEEVLARLWEYLDRELGPEEARSVREHLFACYSCRPAYECDRAFLNLLSRLRTSSRAPQSLVRWMQTGLRTQP